MKTTKNELYNWFNPETFTGKFILITGGTTGIGRATALLLGSLGNHIFVVGRHQRELDDTIQDYHKFTSEGSITGITADLAELDDVKKLFSKLDEHTDNLDVLINNAALGCGGITDGSASEWDYVIRTNLTAYILCAGEAVSRMSNKGAGHIIHVGSMSAVSREKDSSVYVATKAGVQGFNEALRKEVNEMGIKVSLIEPGKTGTDMQPENSEEQEKQEAENEMLMAEDIAASILFILLNPKRSELIGLQIMPFKQMF